MHTWKKFTQNTAATPRPALFLDRDGVLIEDRHYLSDPTGVALCPGVPALLRYAAVCEWAIVVVTNQSGIGRGFFEWNDFENVTMRMLEQIGMDLVIDGIYANSLVEDASPLGWRKPAPGMFLEAASDLNLSLSGSMVVGDRLSDLQAGVNAGLKTVIHVKTGHGLAERNRVTQVFGDSPLPQFNKNHAHVVLLDNLEQFPYELLSSQINNISAGPP